MESKKQGKMLTTIVLTIVFAGLMAMPVFAAGMTPIKNFVEGALEEIYWAGILCMVIGALVAYFSKNFTKLAIGLLVGGFVLFIIKAPEVIANYGSQLGGEVLK